MQWNVAPTMENKCPARTPQTRAELAKIKDVP